ncbi:peptidase S14 [Anoxybacter fermentans]|uniref:Peptidase S14 n=1 Tax=Anoxybacter fermentans TaxID=1323375 RepID=A0A3S9SXU2_9FIRM|nr:nodulation protein NfeD [Anoxybacter fermentans]AZR73163.1 peptidase S14 [Anoxybacter fermentans]
MNKYRRLIIILLIFLFSVTPILKGAPSDLIYLVKVEGDIDPGLTRFIEKSIKNAERDGAKAIIFQISTFGGLVKSATEIRDLIIDAPLLTVALVKDRAWSAGALITLACDRIYMTPGSSIGAAETRPKEEKYISAFRKEFKATAERKGRNPDIAAAMVDADIEIEGVIERGKLLTLTATEAVELGMADKRLNTVEEILPEIEAEGGVVKVIEPSLSDQFARIITNSYISSLLIIIGFIGLVVEAVTLGWGVGGTIGILSLALFFSGNLLVGNTNWGLILLFLAGMILLGLEFFVVPGFGITGLTGIVLVVASLFLTFENAVLGVYAISIALILALITFVFLIRYFGNTRIWNKIALNAAQTKEDGYLVPGQRKTLIDKEGEALTPLHPAGTALIDGERVDVISQSSYIPKGSRIKVIKVEGTKVIVREI